MIIRVALRCMAASEIADMIPASTIAEIKKSDPSPVFRAYVAGHEGEARGNLVGVGNIVKRWYRAVVEQLYEKIADGLSVFHSHGATNSHEGRFEIGRVVGKRLKVINGRLSAIVACYIAPAHRNLNLDVASIEANVDLELDRNGSIIARNVQDVTALALASSQVETPGFAGATLLGQLQAFAKDQRIGGGIMDITIEDVRAFLKAESGVKPSDLFGVETLAADSSVVGLIKRSNQEAIAGEYAHRKRTEEGFDKTRSTLEKERDDARAEAAALRGEVATGKVKGLYESRKASRKLTDKQAAFIEGRLSTFKPSKPEAIEPELDKYLDGEIDEFAKMAKLLGVEVGTAPAAGGGTDGKDAASGAGSSRDVTSPVDSPAGGEVPNKYVDPAKNPFIRAE